MSRHIVWDWNGTLLDDLDLVISSVNESMSRHGVGPIDGDGYRDHFTRPVRGFYDSLFERSISDEEWTDMNDFFHDSYYSGVGEARLAEDALAALDMVESLGWTQSLLSMSPLERLVPVVESKGLADRFELIDGLSGPTGGTKRIRLREHLRDLKVEPSDALVIGDSDDDAAAARSVGARVVLYDGGTHHLSHLESLGAPVAGTLVEAVSLAAGPIGS